MKRITLLLIGFCMLSTAYSQKSITLNVEVVYDSLFVLDEQYCAAQKDSKWGVVKGKDVVIPFIYDAIDVLGDGMLTYIQDGKVGFCSLDGSKNIEAKYLPQLDFNTKDASTLNLFSYGSAMVYDGQKVRVINKDSKPVLDDTYEIVSKCENTIVFKHGVAYGMADAQGNITTETKYMQIESIIPGQLYAYLAQREGVKLYGLIDAKGEQKSLSYFDDVRLINKHDEFFIKAFMPSGKQALYDANGEIIFQPMYQSIEPSNIPFFYLITEDMRHGIIGRDMILYLPAAYDDAQPIMVDNNILFLAKNEDVSYVFNTKNQMLTYYEGNISNFVSYKDDEVVFICDSFLSYGVMSSTEGWKLPPQYNEISALVAQTLILKKDKKWGAIGLDKKQVVPFEYKTIKFSPSRKYVIFLDGKKNSILINDKGEQFSFDKVENATCYDAYLEFVIKKQRYRLFPDGRQIAMTFKKLSVPSEGLCAAQDEKGWTYVYADNLQRATDKYFDFCTAFIDSELALAIQGDKLQTIDKNFNVVSTILIGNKTNLQSLAQRLMLSLTQAKRENIIKLNGKYGQIIYE